MSKAHQLVQMKDNYNSDTFCRPWDCRSDNCGNNMTRSTIERGRGCNKFVPVLRGNGTKIALTGDICVQPPGEMSWIRGKLADHVGDHVVLSSEEIVLVTSSGTELSHPRRSQSLNNSHVSRLPFWKADR